MSPDLPNKVTDTLSCAVYNTSIAKPTHGVLNGYVYERLFGGSVARLRVRSTGPQIHKLDVAGRPRHLMTIEE